MDDLKKIWEQFKECVSIKHDTAVKKYREEQEQMQIQQRNQIAYTEQIYLQDALGQVLRSTNIIMGLSPVTNGSDLVPDGYELGTVKNIYRYRWLKNTTSSISIPALEIARKKINSAIEIEKRKMETVLQNQLDYEKILFVQQYPAFYRGFQVVGMKDDGMDVIIYIVLDN